MYTITKNRTRSEADHATWQILFNRQWKLVENIACKEWIQGMKKIGMDNEHIPAINECSRKMKICTGWEIRNAENHFLNNDEWFASLRKKKFPATNFIRKQSELDFTPLPDLFHEYFGHIPYFTIPRVAEITQLFATAYFITPSHLRVGVGRLWWHAMEWSFVKEKNKLKVFGAGLIAGKNDLLDSLEKEKIPFSLHTAFNTPKTLNSVQEKYFVIESLSHLKKELIHYIHLQHQGLGDTFVKDNFDITEEINVFKKNEI